MGKKLVLEFVVCHYRERDEFEEGLCRDCFVANVLKQWLGGGHLGQWAFVKEVFEAGAKGGELFIREVLEADGFEDGTAIEEAFVGGNFVGDSSAADALDEDVVAAVGEFFVLNDVTEADGGAQWWGGVVFLFPRVAIEDCHGKLAGGVEGLIDHLAISRLKDVERDNLLREEGDVVERKDGHGAAEVDLNGTFLAHSRDLVYVFNLIKLL